MRSPRDGRRLMLLQLVLLLPLLLLNLQLVSSQKWILKDDYKGKFDSSLRPVLLPGFGDDTELFFSTLYESNQRLTVHKEDVTKTCYLIRGLEDFRPSLLYPISGNLPNIQVKKIAGNVIADFCVGYRVTIAISKRISDENSNSRIRRNAGNGYAYQPRGRYRGQTQSQYLNFGSNNSSPGKAEAESSIDGSRAAVSGTSGMGQAQSQSFGSDCEDCDSRKTQNQVLSLYGGHSGQVGSPYPSGGRGTDLYPGTAGKAGIPDELYQPNRYQGGGQSQGGKVSGVDKQVYRPGDSSTGYPKNVGGQLPEQGLSPNLQSGQVGSPWSQQGFGSTTQQGSNKVPIGPDVDNQGRPLYPEQTSKTSNGYDSKVDYDIPTGPPRSQNGHTDRSNQVPYGPQSTYLPQDNFPVYKQPDQIPPGQQPSEKFYPGHIPLGQTQLPHVNGQFQPGYDGSQLQSTHGQGQQPGQGQQLGQGQQPGQVQLQPGYVQHRPGAPILSGQGQLHTEPGQPLTGQGQFQPGQGQYQPGQGQYQPGQGQYQPGQGQYQPGQGQQQTGQGKYQPGQGLQQPGQGLQQSGRDQQQTGQGQFQPGQGQQQTAQGKYQPGQGLLQPGQGQQQTGQGPYQPSQGRYQPGQGQQQTAQGQFQTGQGQYQPSTVQQQPGQGKQPTGQGQYQPGQGLYQPSQGQYQPGQGQYQPGQGQYQPGQGQYRPTQGQQQPGQGKQQTGQGQYQPGQGQYQPAQGQYQPGQEQYQPGHGQYQPGQGQYQPGQGQYQPGQGQYQPGQGHYQSGQGQYQPGQGLQQTEHGLQQTGQGQYRPGLGQHQLGQGQQQTGSGLYQPVQGQYQPGHGQQQTAQGQFQTGLGQQQPGTGQQQLGTGQQQLGQGQQQYSEGQYRPGQGHYQPGQGSQPSGHGQYQPGQGSQPLGQGQYQPGQGSQPSGQGQYQPGQDLQPSGQGQYQPGQVSQPLGQGQYQPGQGSQPLGQGQYQPGQGSQPSGQGQYQPGQGSQPLGQGQYQPGQGSQPSGQGQYQPGQGSQPSGHGQYQPGQGNIQPGALQTYHPGTVSYPGQNIHTGSTLVNGHRVPTATDESKYRPGSQIDPGSSNTGTSAPLPQSQWTGREDYDGFPQTQVIQPGGSNGISHGEGPGSITGDDNSQALASIQHAKNETQASASSMGRHADGVSQTQISGMYSGSGSFSAQAQSTDSKRGAQSQISVGKTGATSSAQGNSGFGQSQALLQFGMDSGATKASALSGGWNHGTNTQVQTNEKGGMADAQANGPGSTSSQAQIGFQPYQENKEDESGNSPFHGGGKASAQSGKYAGQSQTQIQGKFKYGISYNGAAQAESGSKDGSFNKTAFKPLVFNRNSQRSDREANDFFASSVTESNKNIQKTVMEENMNESESKQSTQTVSMGNHLNTNLTNTGIVSQLLPIKSDNEDFDDKGSRDLHPPDDYEDGEDEEDYETDLNSSTDIANQKASYPYSQKEVVVQQMGRGQKQHIILGSLENNGAHVIQDSVNNDLKEGMVFQPGEVIPGTQGYTIPIGFRGRVSSLSHGNETYSFADEHGESQAQTVTLTPGSKNITYSKSPSKTQSLRSWNSENRGSSAPLNKYNLRNSPENYVTVTKSVTGAFNTDKDNPSEDKKFSHTYYTKSSTCGYFTFSCNIVYGSNGRTRICRPKAPTNPDGTPVQC